MESLQNQTDHNQETPDRDESLERMLNEGIQLIHDKDLTSALQCFDRIITDYESHYPDGEGKTHLACLSLDEFLAFLKAHEKEKQSVVWLNPCYAQAHYYKGYTLIQLDRLEEAINELEQAVSLNPMHGAYYLELAYIYARLKKFDVALKLYIRATKTDFSPGRSSTAAAFRGIGFIYIESGLLAAAINMYERSLEIEPDHAIAKNELEYIENLRRLGYREAKVS